jgi:type I restriction enzyme S subunit
VNYWARLETHFDTLCSTEASIDQLKRTILQLAVMDKLLPQDPHDEPAHESMREIENGRKRLDTS